MRYRFVIVGVLAALMSVLLPVAGPSGLVSQAGAFNRLADQRAIGLYQHFDRVFLRIVVRRKGRPAVGKQISRGKHDIQSADQ